MSAPKTPRFSKLLVCTDNSPSSPGVINTALEVGRLTSAKLRLLEVVMTPLYQYQLLTSLEQMRAYEQQVRAQLQPHHQQLQILAHHLVGQQTHLVVASIH